jgi:hypothetical protein
MMMLMIGMNDRRGSALAQGREFLHDLLQDMCRRSEPPTSGQAFAHHGQFAFVGFNRFNERQGDP